MNTRDIFFNTALSLRASAIIFGIRMGPPGQFIRFGKTDDDQLRQQ